MLFLLYRNFLRFFYREIGDTSSDENIIPLPEFDRDRVYPSDIRKLVQWYNILVGAGITDFTVEEGEEVAVEEVKQEVKKPAPKQQVKTQKAAATSARTGVGSKKG